MKKYLADKRAAFACFLLGLYLLVLSMMMPNPDKLGSLANTIYHFSLVPLVYAATIFFMLMFHRSIDD